MNAARRSVPPGNAERRATARQAFQHARELSAQTRATLGRRDTAQSLELIGAALGELADQIAAVERGDVELTHARLGEWCTTLRQLRQGLGKLGVRP